MPGYTKDENSLAAGVPDRTISPETGSFGNATKTNTGDTSEGTNQDHESAPPPAAGLGATTLTTDDLGERRSFGSDMESADPVLPSGVEPVYQQIADGGDRFDPDKRLGEDDERREERLSEEQLRAERLRDEDRPDRPLP